MAQLDTIAAKPQGLMHFSYILFTLQCPCPAAVCCSGGRGSLATQREVKKYPLRKPFTPLQKGPSQSKKTGNAGLVPRRGMWLRSCQVEELPAVEAYSIGPIPRGHSHQQSTIHSFQTDSLGWLGSVEDTRIVEWLAILYFVPFTQSN